jgi:hypothetical protein
MKKILKYNLFILHSFTISSVIIENQCKVKKKKEGVRIIPEVIYASLISPPVDATHVESR